MSLPRSLVPHPTDPTLMLVPLTKGFFAVISAVDAPAVGERHWQVMKSPRSRTPYAFTGSRPRLGLHAFVGSLMGLPSDAMVDHRNGNGLDCRRSNLRSANKNQNQYNVARRRDNSTGVKGINRKWGKYQARVMAGGVSRYLGLFDTLEEAAAAVRGERTRLHGEFANHGEYLQ